MNVLNLDDLMKIDFRIGTVVDASILKKARQPSYQLQIDFGQCGRRASVAQLPHNYTLDEIIGKKVVSVINLASRRIAGFKSETLVVGFADAQGFVLLLNLRQQNSNLNGVSLFNHNKLLNEISYEDFEKVSIYSATLTQLKVDANDPKHFHAQLDLGPLGVSNSILENIDSSKTKTYISTQVAVVTNFDTNESKILTFVDPSINFPVTQIPLGVDRHVTNGQKLF